MLTIIGAGGHGKDLAAIAERSGVPYYLCDTRTPSTPVPTEPCEYVLGLSYVRQRVAMWPQFEKWPAGILIDPDVVLGPGSELSPGCTLAPGVVFLRDVRLGAHTHVHYGVKATRTRVGAFCTLGPGATICGDVSIGDRCTIGAASVIREKILIGNDVTVGAGAVVVDNLPDGAVVMGNPAR